MKIKNSKHKVAIFCGSMFGSAKGYKDIAVKVTEYLCKQDYDIVYGGGENGLMGVVANTALKNKAHVTGIIPQFLDHRETIHHQINELHITKTMEERKKKFLSLSDSFIALPGGGGTIEEIGLVLSALQLGIALTNSSNICPAALLQYFIHGVAVRRSYHQTFRRYCSHQQMKLGLYGGQIRKDICVIVF